MLSEYMDDVSVAYESRSFFSLLKSVLLNPCTQACLLIRLALCTGSFGYVFFRHILILKHGIDVGKGAKVGGGLYLPHPVNIVIGKGVVIENNVTLYQGVTLGKSQGGYPKVGSNTVVFPNCVIVGAVVLPESSMISALTFLRNG